MHRTEWKILRDYTVFFSHTGGKQGGVCKHLAQVYSILPPTATITGYALGLSKLSRQFLGSAQNGSKFVTTRRQHKQHQATALFSPPTLFMHARTNNPPNHLIQGETIIYPRQTHLMLTCTLRCYVVSTILALKPFTNIAEGADSRRCDSQRRCGSTAVWK